jgi:hypothetical protein
MSTFALTSDGKTMVFSGMDAQLRVWNFQAALASCVEKK